jgi:hypothetical protein
MRLTLAKLSVYILKRLCPYSDWIELDDCISYVKQTNWRGEFRKEVTK